MLMDKVVAVSHHPDDHSHLDPVFKNRLIPFTAHLSEEEDRNRLIAFLKEEGMVISKLIHNQPFMLKPSEVDNSDNVKKVDILKQKVRILVETPLFVNAELIEHDLINRDAKILQIIQKQYGIYGLLRAGQLNMKRCLEKSIKELNLGVTSLTPGIYSQRQIECMDLKREFDRNQSILNVEDVSMLILNHLMSETKDNKEYSRKLIWDIYEDLIIDEE